MAMHTTRGMPGFPNVKGIRNKELIWGLAATEGSTTMTHINDDGFAASLTVKAGLKLWVLMDSGQGVIVTDNSRNLYSINAFPPGFFHGKSEKDLFRGEGILLTVVCIMYVVTLTLDPKTNPLSSNMRQLVPHYVAGIQNLIIHRWHFYATSTIFDSCIGIIYTFILHYNVTN
jgi:hypothetical protein